MGKYSISNNSEARSYLNHLGFVAEDHELFIDTHIFIGFDTEIKIYFTESYLMVLENNGYKKIETWGELYEATKHVKRDNIIDTILDE